MSRLGDLLHTERIRRKMTLRQVAKLAGASESYIKQVEEGTKIIGDEQARRILKKMGLQEQTEQNFTLDDIASTVDLDTIAPKAVTKAVPAQKPEKKESEQVFSTNNDDTVSGSIWLDALTSVLKNVPIYNVVMQPVDHRLLPIQNGHIEGASPEKVFYVQAPDDSMRGFRILQNDLCFVVPCNSPVDDAIMLVEFNHHRFLRKIKKIDAMSFLLQSYDREYSAEPCSLQEINILGRVTKVEFSL